MLPMLEEVICYEDISQDIFQMLVAPVLPSLLHFFTVYLRIIKHASFTRLGDSAPHYPKASRE